MFYPAEFNPEFNPSAHPFRKISPDLALFQGLRPSKK
jgi:hypothetical protein